MMNLNALRNLLNTYERQYLKNIKPPKNKEKLKNPENIAHISVKADQCYGELRVSETGDYFLDICEMRLYGTGERKCFGTVSLMPQSYSLLQYGLELARLEYANRKKENSQDWLDESECLPNENTSLILQWDMKQLQDKLLDNPNGELSKNDRGIINTAISRMRKLVLFSDGAELVYLEDKTQERRTTIPIRYSKRIRERK